MEPGYRLLSYWLGGIDQMKTVSIPDVKLPRLTRSSWIVRGIQNTSRCILFQMILQVQLVAYHTRFWYEHGLLEALHNQTNIGVAYRRIIARRKCWDLKFRGNKVFLNSLGALWREENARMLDFVRLQSRWNRSEVTRWLYFSFQR